MKDEKISLSTEQEQRIEKLLEKSKKLKNKRPFQTREEFVVKAIEMWLAWEEDPKTMIGLMNSYPKTQSQEDLMQMMVQQKFQKYDAEGELQLSNPLETPTIDEEKEIKKKEETNDLRVLRDNLKETKKFIQNNRGINKLDDPKDKIHYDGYPLIWRYYSRILPVKLIITVLADMMRDQNDDKIRLDMLRTNAIDICKEFFQEIKSYEDSNRKNIDKTNSLRPGFPDVTGTNDDGYKMHEIQKRFMDRFVGKVVSTKNEENISDSKSNNIQGALAALDLITCFEESNKAYITFTETGKLFYLLDNDLINKDFSKEKKLLSAFSSKESEFIYTKILPNRKLEYKIIDNILKEIKKSDKGKCTSDEISKIMHTTIRDNPSDHNNMLDKDLRSYEDSKNSDIRPKLDSWRAATMGRLVEIKKVKWVIESHGSEYKLLE